MRDLQFQMQNFNRYKRKKNITIKEKKYHHIFVPIKHHWTLLEFSYYFEYYKIHLLLNHTFYKLSVKKTHTLTYYHLPLTQYRFLKKKIFPYIKKTGLKTTLTQFLPEKLS